MSISRRDVLKSLAVSAAATSVLRVIPAHAAEMAHKMIAAEKAAAPAKAYTPKFFSSIENDRGPLRCVSEFMSIG